MTLTIKVDKNKWKDALPWLLSNVGPCGTCWAYDDHWRWVKVYFSKIDDYTLFCLAWR